MGKVPDQQHSMSPPAVTDTGRSVQDRVEPLPPSAEPKEAQHRPTTQREGATNGSIPSPPAPQGLYALTSKRTEQDIDDITAIPVPQYQAPHAQMQSYTPRDTNRTNNHVQTQYEKDIYSQLNETTREHAEPMRVYTAGSEPIQSDSSPMQEQMEPLRRRSNPSTICRRRLKKNSVSHLKQHQCRLSSCQAYIYRARICKVRKCRTRHSLDNRCRLELEHAIIIMQFTRKIT